MNLGFFPSFKEGIQQLVSEYSTRAIFVGTRYSDPNSGMVYGERAAVERSPFINFNFNAMKLQVTKSIFRRRQLTGQLS